MENVNELMRWVKKQPQTSPFLPAQLLRITEPEGGPFPKFWRSPMVGKVLIKKLPPDADPNKTTVLGGMCLVNTVEMKNIYKGKITFMSEADFERWYASWYPRIDQIHDAVGIPPRVCKEIIYVVEDSFFAGRLASYTGLNKSKIQGVLRKVHEKQGHPVLARYLKALGYSGKLTHVYTSDVDKMLDTALKMWERMFDHSFRTCDRDFAKVEFMYTGFWLDLLGIKDSAIIYEAASKMKLRGWIKLDAWFEKNHYGSQINRDLGAVGYVPFLTTQGDGSILSFEQVPNFSNYKTFVIADEDMLWYIANLLFTKQTVVKNGPSSLPKGKAIEMIEKDLSQYFFA